MRFCIESSQSLVSLVTHLSWPEFLEKFWASSSLQQFQIKSSVDIRALKRLTLWRLPPNTLKTKTSCFIWTNDRAKFLTFYMVKFNYFSGRSKMWKSDKKILKYFWLNTMRVIYEIKRRWYVLIITCISVTLLIPCGSVDAVCYICNSLVHMICIYMYYLSACSRGLFKVMVTMFYFYHPKSPSNQARSWVFFGAGAFLKI